MSVAAQLAGFAGAMRAHGIRVVLTDEVDAATALTLVDLLDRAEVRRGLRIALKVPRDAWATFDRLFDEHWGGTAAPEVPLPPPTYPREHPGARWRWDGARVRLELPESAPPEGDEASYSPEALLRHKPFDQLSAGELAAMERLVARLALRLAARRSRRLLPTRGRGSVDLRRSFRHSLATEGEPFRLARRARAPDEPRLVLLYDTSGSMDPYTRVHLAFAFAVRRVIRRTEIFTFNTALTRVTGLVAPGRAERSLERLSAAVPDWSGGTRIGECLAGFVATYANPLVGRDATIVIVSDGLDLGDAAVLAGAMRALHERAGKVVWLNPLAGDARYEPTAAGMAAALPYVDHLAPGHDLAALEGLLRTL
ncbi:MAG TPA: VWA domain-containing protein [Burkholderiales bacterium]|nr:VWA domain-containing protein [Burkholderiales bacterium]